MHRCTSHGQRAWAALLFGGLPGTHGGYAPLDESKPERAKQKSSCTSYLEHDLRDATHALHGKRGQVRARHACSHDSRFRHSLALVESQRAQVQQWGGGMWRGCEQLGGGIRRGCVQLRAGTQRGCVQMGCAGYWCS
eukprot:scaffold78647_cov18-Tisochrysis_lutea.AAC.1